MAMISRRHALAGGLATLPILAAIPAEAQTTPTGAAEARLQDIEQRNPGRICVAILDVASGKRIEHRADEPILLCSTFKVLAAAKILQRVDAGLEKLDRRVIFAKSDVVDYSPITGERAGDPGMTVSEICEAALVHSDNTAGNLMLASFGGPGAITAFCRDMGDKFTRIDRAETEMNYPDGPNDRRDTTTAAAMAENLRKLFFTDVLSNRSRAKLAAWMITCTTGDARLRAGLPKYWLTAGKTGTNNDKFGNANDVAVVCPTDRPPLIISAYCEIPGIRAEQRNAIVAEIGRVAATL